MRFLAKLVFVQGSKPMFNSLDIFGSQVQYEELARLEKANPQAYGNLVTTEVCRYKTARVITVYKILHSYGWVPPLNEVDGFVMEEISRD